MSVIDTLEVKLHVTTLGIPELEHLLAMLNANVENLPTIVVKAMTALADSCAAADAPRSEPNVTIDCVSGVSADDVARALSMENQRIMPIGIR